MNPNGFLNVGRVYCEVLRCRAAFSRADRRGVLSNSVQVLFRVSQGVLPRPSLPWPWLSHR